MRAARRWHRDACSHYQPGRVYEIGLTLPPKDTARGRGAITELMHRFRREHGIELEYEVELWGAEPNPEPTREDAEAFVGTKGAAREREGEKQ